MAAVSSLTPARLRLLYAAVLACLVALAVAPAGARAAIGFDSFSATFNEPGPAVPYGTWYMPGDPVTQAGAHADFVTEFKVSTVPDPQRGSAPSGYIKDMVVDMPVGFYGNPRNLPTCESDEVATKGVCSPDTQVGIAEVQFGPQPDAYIPIPVYNMATSKEETATLMFPFAGSPVKISMSVRRDGSNGLRATIRNISQYLAVYGTRLRIWGTPADSSHDFERFFDEAQLPGISAGIPRKPFITMPPRCDAPLVTEARMRSWSDQDTWATATSTLPALKGCQSLHFDASLDAQPTTTQPDVPSGYEFDLTIPQDNAVKGVGTPHLKRAVVTLPEGVSISPSAADGLQACTDAQLALGSDAEPTCPAASKIGTVTVDTPVLAKQLTGDIVVGSQTPPELYRIFLIVRGSGVLLKLPGSVDADPQTGRLTTTFDNNPQLPFTTMKLRFKGGPRAPLANPPTCGTKTTVAELTPWQGETVTSTSSFTIDCPGVSGFSPDFSAGSTQAIGGSFSPFALRIDRRDGEQYLAGVSLEMPPGLIGKLAGVPLCPDAAAAAGTCGAESRIGTATVGSGPGGSPFFLKGSVSLTGPYKGAPYGLAVAVRAIAGPYDLGTVVVRQALHIDPVDAHVTVVSDPLPTILEGVPLRLRSINVDVDRPGFMMTPTSCAEKRIGGSLQSTEGAVHGVGSRFQVGGCRALAFTPKLALRLTGKKQTAAGRHPGLRAVMRQPVDQANMKAVKVALPKSVALDPDNANGLCGYEAGLAADCPASSIIGKATAHTPILDRPLTGPVHFVQGVRFDPKTGNRIRTLPTLLVKLRGQVAIDLRATSSVKRGRLVSTFPAIPDAPVSRFQLSLNAGSGGILVVTGDRSLCRGRQSAGVETDGQNGKRADYRAVVRTPCAGRKKRRR